jgi:cytochrome c biogenesis protein CcdA
MSLLDITSFLPVLLVLLTYAVGVIILYWVVRLAVRQAIQDADERRSRTHQ